MRALDLTFKDCRLVVDWDWKKYADGNLPVYCVLDLISRNFTALTARDVTFEEAIIQTRFPISEDQRHSVIEILMEKNALLDK